MNSRLVLGFTFAVVLTACGAQTPGSTAPRPLKPQDGPRATIYVDPSGGAFSRQIRTRFRLDRAGYVMVGHLGGDGSVRVLYPETPYASGWVAAGKSISLRPVSAMYDMAPHLFSFATTPYRNAAARSDSYDGFGHGYVFIVTSRYPIYLGAFAGNRSFETLEVQDYDNESDPRIAVRELVDDVTTGPYTLKYARNDGFSRYAIGNSCSAQWALMSYDPYFGPWSFGYSIFAYPGMSLVNALAFAHYYGFERRCGASYYAGYPFYFRTYSTVYNPVRPVAPPQGELTPELQRPTRRTLENPERGRGPLTSGFSPFGRRSGFDGERTSRRPISSRPQYPNRGRDRGSDVTRRTNSEIHRPERGPRPVESPRTSAPAPRPPAPVQAPTTTSQGDNPKGDRPRPQQ